MPINLPRVPAAVAFAAMLLLSARCTPVCTSQSARFRLPASPCAPDSTVVQTQSGPACGTVATAAGKTVEVYRGMPYASAGRWEDPQPYGAWDGTFPATNYGPICPQKAAKPTKTVKPPTQSEDCLWMNVWRPAGADKLPVMVFIHGGAFVEGSGSASLFDGAYMAASQNVVVATFNYRLGALGFLAGKFAGGELEGNFGFKDQQTALRWVNRNIGSFGGDAGNITIFGESSGAQSVALHLLSAPASRDLFQKAIMESNPAGVPYKSLSDAHAFGKTLEEALHCRLGGLACMKKRCFETIVEEEEKLAVTWPMLFKGFADLLVWAPVIDHKTITSQPVNGTIDKPTILGTNLNEANMFISKRVPEAGYKLILRKFFGKENEEKILVKYPPLSKDDTTQALFRVLDAYFFNCANQHIAGRAKDTSQVWTYHFRPLTSPNLWGPKVLNCVQPASGQGPICHAFELPYVFNSWSEIGIQPTPDMTALTEAMVGYWGSMARSGAPSGQVAWAPYSSDQNYLQLKTPPEPQQHIFPDCTFWDQIGYDLEKMPHTIFEVGSPPEME